MTEAGWALLGVVVGIVGTGLINWLMQSRQFAPEKQMFQLQNLSAAMVTTVLQEMLNNKSSTDRSFLALTERIGGYSADQIRQFLHEFGAKKTSRTGGAHEWGYLASRQEARTAKCVAAK